MHVPVPGGQGRLQAPQLSLSVRKLRHAPLQKSCPGGQQPPFRQVVPAGHTLPQAPQWLSLR